LSTAELSRWEVLPDHLSLVTIGPGDGESLILVIPPDKAVVVDSLLHPRSTRVSPVLEFLESRGLELTAVLLTHPHKDHAEGFDLLVESCTGRVGCGRFFLEDFSKLDAEGSLRNGYKRQALSSIRNRWERDPDSRWELLSESEHQIEEATLTVLHPSLELNKQTKDVNALSSPVLVQWREVRLLLGAEVPKKYWSDINKQFDSTRHTGYKVAHHCSIKNFEPSAFAGDRERYWVGTPCRRKPMPPRFEDNEGVDLLLRTVERLYLTSVLFEVKSEGTVLTRTRLASLAEAVSEKSPIPGVSSVPKVEPREPKDAYVAAHWNSDGDLAYISRGDQCVLVKS